MPMQSFKRGDRWWFKFKYAGRVYRESAGTGNEQLAGKIERKRRREIEELTHGIKKAAAPVLLSVARRTGWSSRNRRGRRRRTSTRRSMPVT